ncbi:aldo/keto reductase [Planctomycetota bacterium]
MKKKLKNVDRRDFLKTIGTAGIATSLANVTNALASSEPQAGPAEPNAPVDPNAAQQEQALLVAPRKDLGKTGVKVSSLGLGMMYNVVDNQIILRSALRYGVNYWDTANNYGGGNSELGIGVFFERNPEERENIFLVSKASNANSVAQIEERLQTSLERMKTDYIDLYDFPHGLNDPSQLSDEVKQWVESAKEKGQIKYFGFSAHSNMATALEAAAKLGWIDVIMFSYNYRLAQDAALQKAIDACYEQKIGLVAMKAAGRASSGDEGGRGRGGRGARGERAGATGERGARGERGTPGERGARRGAEQPATVQTAQSEELTESLIERGFTQLQAAIKLVMDDERISCVNVGMETVPILTANVAAALDKESLTAAEQNAFRQYAQATCSGYCAGCSQICDSALGGNSYVRDIMRYLMYYNSYGSKEMARELFAEIPLNIRNHLLQTDYSLAEARCPQHIPISEYITEAVGKLA